jgi:FixJ family two-component response regulator
VVQGCSNQEIASHLNISPRTVKQLVGPGQGVNRYPKDRKIGAYSILVHGFDHD